MSLQKKCSIQHLPVVFTITHNGLSYSSGEKNPFHFFNWNYTQSQLLSKYTLVPWMCCEGACWLMLVTALKETALGDLRLFLSTTQYDTNAKGVQKLFSTKCGDLDSSVFCLGAIFASHSHSAVWLLKCNIFKSPLPSHHLVEESVFLFSDSVNRTVSQCFLLIILR